MLARDILQGSSKQPQRVTPFNATTTFITIPPRPTPPPHTHTARAWRATWIFKTTTTCHTLQCNYNVYKYPAPPHPTPHPHSARVTCYFKTTTTCHTLQCNYNVYNYPTPPHPTPHPHSARVTCYFKTTTTCHTLQCNYNVYNYPTPPHPPHPTPTQRARDMLLQNNHNVSHFNATTTFIILPPHPTHPTPHPHSARVTCYFKTTTTCHTLQCNYSVYNYPAPPHPPHPTPTQRARDMLLQNNHNVSHTSMQLQRL